MQSIYQVIDRVAALRCPVLILGESGTGKELVARAIHGEGPCQRQPFVPVDCSAVTSTLFETEMFGCVKNAYTGAFIDRPGLLKSSNGGTLFLDEIGNLPLEMQVKLLRSMQQREIRPVGSNDSTPFTGRIIVATNANLHDAVQEGRFRQDLYFRLNVVQIELPPLRKRTEDIAPLVEFFVKKYCDEYCIDRTVSAAAMKQLIKCRWAGNVRELQNVILRAVALEPGPLLEFPDLDRYGQDKYGPAAARESKTLMFMERRAIFQALDAASGDKALAAQMLGIGKTTLYRRLKEYQAESQVASLGMS